MWKLVNLVNALEQPTLKKEQVHLWKKEKQILKGNE